MNFTGSLRLRLQLWHGLLLAVVLTGFGWTAWQLQRRSLFNGADQELNQRFLKIGRSLHPSVDAAPPGLPGPPGMESGFMNSGPPGLRPRPIEEEMSDGGSVYEIVWDMNERKIRQSALAPQNVPIPTEASSRPITRMRGDLRELIHLLPSGEIVLVGKNVHPEIVSSQHFAWILAGVGGLVLLVSLGIGWWITARALQPLHSISSTALRVAEGDLSQRIPLPHDATEITDLVNVLNQAFTRLEASFVRQIQFSADASHELRTPISVILTHTQNALARDRSPEDYRESLAACQRAARRMKLLTESLLALVRLDHGEQRLDQTTCRLDHLVADALESQKSLAQEHRIVLISNLSPVDCFVNPEQLIQVVTNLLTNAIRYNSAGGSVTVSTAQEENNAILSVQDTGHGIAGDDLPRLFERFYRVDKSRSGHSSGAGLGLAITEAIVKAHGGTIEVTSELGAGSLFTVRLPAGPLYQNIAEVVPSR
jgi:signal transduction histidine kinase